MERERENLLERLRVVNADIHAKHRDEVKRQLKRHL
jgi:hypothetical protein